MKLKLDFDTYFRNALRPLKGLKALQGPLGLTHVTLALYEPLYLDAKDKHRQFNLARQGKTGAYAALRPTRAGAVAYLTQVRNYLTGFLGGDWSGNWAPLGFLNGSLALPGSAAGLCEMLENVRLYFTDHPQHENAARLYTAAHAATLCTPLSEVLAGVEDCKYETRAKRDARGAALALLDQKLSALRSELETVLPPTDPRWLKFFDRIPGDLRTPEAVEEVTAEARPGGVIALDWPDAVRAVRYQVLKQVVGADENFVVADTVEESAAQVSGVPAGATVRLKVVPLNGVGPGAASAVIEVQAA